MLRDIAAPSRAMQRMIDSAFGVTNMANEILRTHRTLGERVARRPMESVLDDFRVQDALRSLTDQFGRDLPNRFDPPIDFGGVAYLSQMNAALDNVSIERHSLATSRLFDSQLALRSEFATMAELAEQAMLIRTGIGRQFEAIASELTRPHVRVLDSLDSLSRVTRDLWATWEANPARYPSFPVSLRTAPTRELYESSAATDVLVRPHPKSDDALETAEAEAPETPIHLLEAMLVEVGRDLLKPYRGALAVLKRREPDYARHFTISVRELLTHVMHRLAPDSEVRKWTSRAEDYHQGRPTRAARLRFILRHQTGDEFAQWVQQDVDMAIQLMDYLHGGTHKMGDDIPVGRLRWVQRRAEAVLMILIEASRSH
jgi:hypothetical protein